MIELRRATKVYKTGTVALNKVNLSVEQGEFVFITGASGAGKTSLVKLLLCEEMPTSGDVLVNGKNLRRLTRRQIPKYRRSVGVVFQDFRLIPSMNVFDNVAFAMRAVGRPYREIRRRVQAALEIVELTEKKRVFPDQLSGGEQQRVALARAIVNAPKIIIADEPTGNLDGKLSLEMMKMLNFINASGITVLVVTHANNLVDYFGKRTIVLENGQLVRDIPAEDRSAADINPDGSSDPLTVHAAETLIAKRRKKINEPLRSEPADEPTENNPTPAPTENDPEPARETEPITEPVGEAVGSEELREPETEKPTEDDTPADTEDASEAQEEEA